MPAPRATKLIAALSLAQLCLACGAGSPLMHPARALPTGDVRAAIGMSADAIYGDGASRVRAGQDAAAAAPDGASAAQSQEFADGAVALASLAPAVAPFVAARVGVGQRFEAGLAYTGRAFRADVRRSFDSKHTSFSVGLAGSTVVLSGSNEQTLRGANFAGLRGYGVEAPVLLGWHSDADVYWAWAGARVGYETVRVEPLSSEPRAASADAITLVASRFYAGPVAGLAVGLRRLHVGFELAGAFNAVNGRMGQRSGSFTAFSLTPATSLLWTF
jgi:hypothetical protein